MLRTWIKQRMSYSGCALTKSTIADSVLAVLVAVSLARRCTFAPHATADAAIASSSVETQTSAKTPEASAGWITCRMQANALVSLLKFVRVGAAQRTQSMSGRPASGLMFFLGIETDPPRAGISAMTRGWSAGISVKVDAESEKRSFFFFVNSSLSTYNSCHKS